MADITAYIKATNDGFTAAFGNLPNDLPEDANEPKVEHTTTTIKGVDNNDIALHVFRKAGSGGEAVPAVVYSHGGGMTILDTINPTHVRWCTSLAVAGVVAIAVDFRNAWTNERHNPFPCGLNDCAAAAQYIASHKSELGISKVVLQGESGGANLALATALKANKEGWINAIDGVYACVPYISNGWGWPAERKAKELPSLLASDGYLLDMKGSGVMGFYYSPDEATNPLAFPYHASVESLKGLPPHVVSVDELDPLRDEGMAYFRKLQQAGVDAVGFMNMGITHAASLIFRQALPETHKAALRHIVAFAKSL